MDNAVADREIIQDIARKDREARLAIEREFEAAHPPKPHFEFVTAVDLATRDCRVDYLIPGWLCKSQPCVLAGPKKCLKTNVVIDLAVSLATKHKFLGKFHVEERTPTLVMSGESGAATIQETYRRIAWSKNWAIDRITDLYFSFDVPSIADDAQIGEVKKFCIENDIGCLVIDPAYLAMSGIGDSASNLFAVGKQLSKLTDLANSTGATIVLIHHTSKGRMQYENPPELDDIAWAGFPEWARQWILLGRRGRYDPEQPGYHELWATAGGSAGHSSGWALNISEGCIDDDGGRRWDVEILSTAEARYEAAQAANEAKDEAAEQKKLSMLNNRREQILAAFRRHKEGASKTTIRDSARVNSTNFQPILDQLMDEGIVEEFKASNGRMHYRITNRTTGQP